MKKILKALIITGLCLVFVQPLKLAANAESSGITGSVNGCDITLFDKKDNISQIKAGNQNIGVNITSSGTSSLLEYDFGGSISFEELKVSLNINSLVYEGNQPEIFFNFNNSENANVIKDRPYICVRIYGFEKRGITLTYNIALQLKSNTGTVLEELIIEKCPMLGDVYNNTQQKNNIQFAVQTSQKYAYGIEGIADGSLIDYLSFKTNKITTTSDEDEIIQKGEDSLYSKIISLKGGNIFMNLECIEKTDNIQTADISIMQIANYKFYTYWQVKAPYVLEDSVSYSKMSIRWDTESYSSYSYQGYILARYIKGSSEPDKVNIFKTKATSLYNMSFLKQDTSYVFKIGAYANISAPAPALILEYGELEVATKAGGLGPYLLGFAIFALIFAAFTYIYVNWYDIKDKINNIKNRRK